MKINIKLSLLFVTLLSFYTNTSFAQYQSVFGNTQTSWQVVFFCTIEHACLDSFAVVPNQDTIIQGKTFKKISSFLFPTFGVYLAEDTVTGKLWAVEFEYLYIGNVDLIMDMTLTVGDTFTGSTPTQEIYIVDAVYMLNNKKHIRYNQYVTNAPVAMKKFTMIEGAGTNLGISRSYYGLGGYLICQHKDDTIAYEVTNYPGVACGDVGALANQKQTISKSKIFPNPTTGHFTLVYTLQTAAQVQLTITDALGRRITVKQFGEQTAGKNTAQVNISSLATGMYIYNLSTQNGHAIAKGILYKQ